MSDRLRSFASYPFAEVDRAKSSVPKGFLIDMGVGDPDLPPPDAIQEKLVEALEKTNIHRYPSYAGEKFFKDAVIEYMKSRFGVELSRENVLCLIGSKEGIFHLPFAILNPGDKAFYTVPGYPVYKAGIEIAGGKGYPISLEEALGFKFNTDDIPDGMKLGFVNYPNNPTGSSATIEFYDRLITRAKRDDFIIANDAAYAEIYYNNPPPSILELPGALDNAVEFHSFSKTFSMTGWRVGFVVGNADVTSALGTLKKNIDSGVFRAIQYAVAWGMQHPELIEDIRSVYHSRMKLLVDGLKSAGWDVRFPDATFYLWARVPEGSNSMEFAKYLIKRTGIVAVPSILLCDASSRYIRFSVTLPDEKIKEAVERIKRLV